MQNKDSLFLFMAKEVEKHVKHYKTDFYKHDQAYMLKKDHKEFFWAIRECGTELYPLNHLKAKDTFSNVLAKYHIEQNNIIKVFKITIAKHGRKHVYGKIKEVTIADFKHWINNNEEDYLFVLAEIKEKDKPMRKELFSKKAVDKYRSKLYYLVNELYPELEEVSIIKFLFTQNEVQQIA